MAKEQLITEKWVSKQDECLLKEFAYVEYMIHTHDPSCSADHELICVLISNSVLGLGHDDQTTKPHISSRVKTSHTPLCLFSARFSELEDEHLCDSLDTAEDARDWTRHMEKYLGTGRDINTHTELAGPTNVFGHGGILKLTSVSVCSQVKQAVHTALECGYRHFDCAAAYENEKEVGEALAVWVGPGKVSFGGLLISSRCLYSLHVSHISRLVWTCAIKIHTKVKTTNI